MTILTILEFPDPKLRTKAAPVTEFGRPAQQLVDNMLETMYAANGIGLAATQVDVHQQVIVIDISEERDQPLVFINPQVEVLNDEVAPYDEGCLSVPGFYETIDRPTNVRVKAFDPQGQPFEIQSDGLIAICIQHEIDHLQGKLFVDYLSSIKRNRIRKKLEKLHKQAD